MKIFCCFSEEKRSPAGAETLQSISAGNRVFLHPIHIFGENYGSAAAVLEQSGTYGKIHKKKAAVYVFILEKAGYA